MIANPNGKEVRIMNENGSLVARIHCNSEVSTAYVDGDRVNVHLVNGHCEIWRTNGTLVRKF